MLPILELHTEESRLALSHLQEIMPAFVLSYPGTRPQAKHAAMGGSHWCTINLSLNQCQT